MMSRLILKLNVSNQVDQAKCVSFLKRKDSICKPKKAAANTDKNLESELNKRIILNIQLIKTMARLLIIFPRVEKLIMHI